MRRRRLAAGLLDEIVPEGELRAGAIAFAKKVIAEKRPLRKVREMNEKVEAARGKPELFAEFRKANARKFRGFLAPEYNIRCIEAAVNLPFDQGIATERKLFMELMTGTQSAAQRYVFFAERQVWKVPDVPEDTATIPVKKVGIIGAGTMGGGIAMNFANVGLPVTLVEAKQDALDRGFGVIRKNYETTAKRGKLKPEDVEKRMGLLSGTLQLESLADCDLVIEAVFENMDIKKEVFAKLDRIVKQGAILATNTSGLDVNEIASVTQAPRGGHRPALLLARERDAAAGDRARAEDRPSRSSPPRCSSRRRSARSPRWSGVCPGFVGNRILYARQQQAQAMLMEGAMPWDIDKVLYDFGLPMGPFAMSDLAGLDIGWSKEKSSSSTVREVLCEMDRRGQKTGAGFYDYDAERNAKPCARHREDHQGLHGQGRRDAAQDFRAGDPRALRVPDDQRGREDSRREDRDPPVGHRHRVDQRLRLARVPRRPDVLRRHRGLEKRGRETQRVWVEARRGLHPVTAAGEARRRGQALPGSEIDSFPTGASHA